MTWIADTIREFGKSMGIEDLSPNDDGVVCLAFDAIGTLYLEPADGAVLIYLARDLPYMDHAVLARALELCHFRQGFPMPVSAGLKSDDLLVFVTRIPENDFSLPALEKAVELLAQLHDRTAEGSH